MGDFDQRAFLMPGRPLLIKDIERILEDLGQVLFEYDELVYKDCLYLQNTFYYYLGRDYLALWESHYDFLSSQSRLRQAKMKIAPTQPACLAKYREFLRLKKDRYRLALEWGQQDSISVEESRKLRQLYRQCVLAFHPLLHEQSQPAHRLLYEKARMAYRRDDRQLLQLTANMSQEAYVQDDWRNLSMVQLLDWRGQLLNQLFEWRYRIGVKRSEFPYVIHSQILSETQRQKMQASFRQETQRLRSATKRNLIFLDQLDQ
ncbi:MAG: hypothetical protein ACYCDV_08735 [Facklamia hominis]